jgi:hypothetical protein
MALAQLLVQKQLSKPLVAALLNRIAINIKTFKA